MPRAHTSIAPPVAAGAALFLLLGAGCARRAGDEAPPGGRESVAWGAEPARAAPGSAAQDPGAWRHSLLWDDGKAEFCAYEVTWARYGHAYAGRALLVLVKEPWAPDLDVKADRPRPAGFDVLKLNHARDVPTGIYTYHQMASIYLRRDTGALRKVAATSSEACGISTAHMVRGQLETRSYFDGQGDHAMRWPSEALPEDGLPALLRDWVEAAPPPTLRIFPSLMMGRFVDLRPSIYRVSRSEARLVKVPAGVFSGVEIRLTHDTSVLSYVFEASAPHRLLLFQRDDGTEYRLAKAERITYWTMHDPGGEDWLPAATR